MADNENIFEELEKKLRINPDAEVKAPPLLLAKRDVYGTSFVSRRMCTLGNFSVTKGKQKSRKTYMATMLLLAASGTYEEFYYNLFDSKDKILYFDTEQGEYDAVNTIRRAKGIKYELLAFELRGLSPQERVDFIEYEADKYGKETALCVIDGVLDLVSKGMNDEAEAIEIVGKFMKWTKDFNFHLNTIIHQKKADNFALGHLGAYLCRKAELVMSIEKIPNTYISEVVCEDIRGSLPFDTFGLGVDDNDLPILCDVIEKKPLKNSGSYTAPGLERVDYVPF